MEQDAHGKYIGDAPTSFFYGTEGDKQELKEVVNDLITCNKTNEKCEEKVLKEYLKKKNEKLEYRIEVLSREIDVYKDRIKSSKEQKSRFNQQKRKAETDLNYMFYRISNIIDSFDGVDADVHSSLIVKIFRNAIQKSYSEDNIISQINKIKDPVKRRLDNIED